MADDKIEVSITANTDQLKSAMASASASVSKSTKQMTYSAAELNAALQQTGNNITKAGELLASGWRPGITGAQSAAAATKDAASSLSGVAPAAEKATAAVGRFGVVSATATREFVVLGHEILTGRFSRIPGSLLVLTEYMGGLRAGVAGVVSGFSALPPPIYVAIAAVAGLATGFGLMALHAHEAEVAAKGAIAAATFKGVALPTDQAEGFVNELHKTMNVSREVAGKIEQDFANMEGSSAASINAMIKLLPVWAARLGTDPVAAANNLSKVLGNLTGEGEKWLKSVNTSTDTIKKFDDALGKGDQAQARLILLQAMSADTQKVEDRLHTTTKEAIDFAQRYNSAGASIEQQAANTANRLREENKILSNQKTALADAVSGYEYYESMKQAAKPTGAPLADVREQIEANATKLSLEGKSQSEILQAEVEGWQKRLAYNDLVGGELIATTNSLNHAKLELQRASGEEEIANAREQISQLQAAGKLQGTELIQTEASKWSSVLASHKLTKEQEVQVEKDYNEAVARLGATERAEYLKILQDTTSTAKRGSAERILAAQEEVNYTVAIWKEGSVQATEAQKHLTEAKQEAAAEDLAVVRSTANTEITLSQMSLIEARKNLDALVEKHKITADQRAQIEQAFVARLAQLEENAITVEEYTNELSISQYTEMENRKKVLSQQSADEIAAIKLKQITEDAKSDRQEAIQWKATLSELASAEDTFIRDVLTKRQSMARSLEQLNSQLIMKEIENDAQYLTSWILFNAIGLGDEVKTSQGGLLVQTAAWAAKKLNVISGTAAQVTTVQAGNTLIEISDRGAVTIHALNETAKTASTKTGVTIRAATEKTGNTTIAASNALVTTQAVTGETAQTSAVVAGEATQVSATTAGNSSISLSNAMTGLANITKHAASAAAAVYDDVSQIPYVGWILAPPAAAAAFVAVEAFGGFFDEGAWNIPGTMSGVLHAGEMVLPATFASGLRAAASGGGSASLGGIGGGNTVSPTFNISALDAKSVVELFNNPSILRQITKNINAYSANNPSVRGAY